MSLEGDVAHEGADLRIGIDAEGIRERPAQSTAGLGRIYDCHVVGIRNSFETIESTDDHFMCAESCAALETEGLIPAHPEVLREALALEVRDRLRQSAHHATAPFSAPSRGPRVVASPAGDGPHRGVQRWGGRKPRDLEDLLLVEGLPRHQGFRERVELLAVGGQEAPGLLVALVDYLEYLGIDGLGGRLTERLLAGVPPPEPPR